MRAERLLAICDGLDTLVGWLAWIAGHLIIFVAGVQIVFSLLRTLFSFAPLIVQELVPTLNVVLVAVSICFVTLRDAHTRVDILTEGRSASWKTKLEIALVLLLFWPVVLFLLAAFLPYVQQSWRTLEGSRNVGGLGGVFLVKSVLLGMAGILVLQGASVVMRGWLGSGLYPKASQMRTEA